MTENVVSLRGGQLPATPVPAALPEPSEALIAYLEDLLRQAKTGEVVGAAFATLDHDHSTSYSVVGRVGGYAMLGAIECARQVLLDINLGMD